MNTTKKGCCGECGRHGTGCVPSCYPEHCHFPPCSCHVSKQNKGWEARFKFFFCTKQDDAKFHISPHTGAAEVISFFAAELAKQREELIEELFQIENEKWNDAVHCACLGYALVELAGGEDSEGGQRMEKRLSDALAVIRKEV